MPVLQPTGDPNYPSIETIANMVRAIVNDTFAGWSNTPGEGQIVTDQVTNTAINNPFLLNHLNSAIRELYRKLRNVGGPALIQDNYILENLDPIDGPLGPSIPDPTIQTYIDWNGYWYGTTYDTALTLPSDMLSPIKLWERQSGTTDTFMEMTEAADGLGPASQIGRLQQWEWRSGRINFHGATTQRDIRIRYFGILPQFFASDLNYSSTYIPIVDCEDFVAYKTAEKVAFALGNPQAAASLAQTAMGHLFDLKNEEVRRMQQRTYRRRPYNDADTANELDVYGI